jgi:hypothetical protein
MPDTTSQLTKNDKDFSSIIIDLFQRLEVDSAAKLSKYDVEYTHHKGKEPIKIGLLEIKYEFHRNTIIIAFSIKIYLVNLFSTVPPWIL